MKTLLKSSKFIALLIAFIALSWLASGLFFSGVDTSNEEAAGKTIAERQNDKEHDLIEVRVREMQAEPYASDVVVTGRSSAVRDVSIKAETAGRVNKMLVEEGTLVDKGEVLLELEIEDREAVLAQARQNLRQREAEYKGAKNLKAKGFNSEVRLEQAASALEAAKAALRQAEIELENTTIKAPFSGIVYEQGVELGDYVGIGTQVFRIVDLDPIEFTGFVSERQIDALSWGKKARAKILDGRDIQGVISYISPAADPQTRTFRIIMTAANNDLAVKQGKTAEIRIPKAEIKAHKISPAILSLNTAGEVGVKIVDDSDIVRFVPVTILSDNAQFMWVAGAPEKTRFITVGQEFVMDGQKVAPVPADGDGLL